MTERTAHKYKKCVKIILTSTARGVIRHECTKDMDIHHISIESQANVWVLSGTNRSSQPTTAKSCDQVMDRE
jgi:hypothetical protein